MKKIIVFMMLALVANNVIAQDKVILKSGDTLSVSVTKTTDNTIEYTYPNESVINEKQKRDILSIIYSSGRREDIKSNSFNVPIISNPNEWEKVIVTTNRDDVYGLTKEKEIAVNAMPNLGGSASNARDKAFVKLKKKAAKLKCGVVLITNEDYIWGQAICVSAEVYK